jgi:putative oxidoreductase
MNRLIALATRLLGLVKRLDSVALLVARLTVGVLFVSTGWGKVHNLANVTEYFVELHIPAPAFNAVLASWTELLGGTLLVLGLASRLAALPLMVTMTVAILTALSDKIHSVPDLFGQVEWTYLVLLFVVVVFGPGKASVDALVRSRLPPGSPWFADASVG